MKKKIESFKITKQFLEKKPFSKFVVKANWREKTTGAN